MNKIILVKPAPGVRVLDPDTIPPSPLPPEGKKVVQDSYWLRRINAGEVNLVTEPTTTKKTAYAGTKVEGD